MLIKNTDGSYCKIKDIKVSGLKAYVTLIIYSSIPQTSSDIYGNVNRVFSFYLRDKDSTELYKLSNNNYWIDRTHNYDNDSSNVDINMYKQIILEIDITNTNTSDIVGNKWVRYCNIVMVDHTTAQEEAWVSEDLTLISKEIKLPTLSNLHIATDSNDILGVSFKYIYESQEDFNYTNSNLVTFIEIKSIYSNEILESHEIPHYYEYSSQSLTIEFNSLDTYTDPVIVSIYLKNLRGDILQSHSQFFNPQINGANIAVKLTEPALVKTIYVKDSDIKLVKQITNK